MRLDDGLQAFIGYTLTGVWLIVGVALFNSWYQRYRDYLRRFPPVNGVQLDTFTNGNPFGPVAQAIREVFREPQSDPDLEHLRQAARRGRWPYILWIFGFPMLVFGVAALLILSGLIRLV